MEKICKNCTYYYRDGFCTYHLSYWSPDHTCPIFTTEELPLDYDFLYRRCKDYIKICDMYNQHEKMKKEKPDIMAWESCSNYDFFLQCCVNDLARELSKWKTKK